MKVWVNGTLVEDSEAAVSAFDHGLTTGDGVFETMKVEDGRPFALTRHIARLTQSARRLGLPAPDAHLVRSACEQVVAANGGTGVARLRVTYTGGVAPLGSERGPSGPTVVVAMAAQKPWPDRTAIATVPWTRNENGALAGIKSTSYADNVRALAYAKERGASEAIFANTAGNLCEGTGTNIFVVLGGALVTPPLSSGCLAGVTRALVIQWAGAEERDVPMSALKEAEEIFISSSTRDAQPVDRVDDRALDNVPGPVTRRVMDIFAARSAENPDP